MRQTDALQQLLVAGVGFKAVEARVGIEKNKSAFTASVCIFQDSQRAIDFSQCDIHFRSSRFL